MSCPVCGKDHDSSACQEPVITTYVFTNKMPDPVTPNNCARFIYGQGCYGCHRHFVCWPTYTTGGTF